MQKKIYGVAFFWYQNVLTDTTHVCNSVCFVVIARCNIHIYGWKLVVYENNKNGTKQNERLFILQNIMIYMHFTRNGLNLFIIDTHKYTNHIFVIQFNVSYN